MERTNFERLPVYEMAEKLAGEIWNMVAEWQYFAKDTIGKQSCALPTVSVQISLRGLVAAAFKTIVASGGLRQGP